MRFLRDNRFFLALLILFLVLPWVKIGHLHLLLFNFPHNRFEFFGFGTEMDLYSLIGTVILLGFGVALISALSLSRFYCGRFCPNTFFAHLLTFFKRKKKSIFFKSIGFLLLTFLALVFAFSIVAYGISTSELIDAIMHLSFAGWLVIVLSFLMLAEVYMIQGWYCAYLCPYGAICAVLPLEDRLTYQYEDVNNRCIDCHGCVQIYPIPELDIRNGFDIRCIQCGLCEAACEIVFAKSDTKSLISIADRFPLSAAGRGKGIFIAIFIIFSLMVSGVWYLKNVERLDSCRLENSFLHPVQDYFK
jgi:polyferredoxin